MHKVYVAGASKNIERTEAFLRRIYDYPNLFEVTFDWTRDVRAAMAAGRFDSDLSDEQRAVFAMTDAMAVIAADTVVVLAETPIVSGHAIELGIAIAHRFEKPSKYIIVSGGGRRSIFTSPGLRPDGRSALLVDAEVFDDDEAWTILYACAVSPR